MSAQQTQFSGLFVTVAAGASALAAAAATAHWFRHRASAAADTLDAVCCCVNVGPLVSEASADELRLPLKRDPYDASPRSEYLSWDEYFMALAFLSAQRSKDPNKQVR